MREIYNTFHDICTRFTVFWIFVWSSRDLGHIITTGVPYDWGSAGEIILKNTGE